MELNQLKLELQKKHAFLEKLEELVGSYNAAKIYGNYIKVIDPIALDLNECNTMILKLVDEHVEVYKECLKDYNNLYYKPIKGIGLSQISRLLELSEFYKQKLFQLETTSNEAITDITPIYEICEKLIKSPEFKSLNVTKEKTLSSTTKEKIYKIAQNLYPDYKLNKNSLFATLRRKGYAKPRKK